MKDSEALDLQQKLGEEQERVKKMEEKVAELSRNIHAGRAKGDKGSKKDSEMVAELQKQTALATEYRLQVEELEEMLVTAGQEPDGDKKKRKAITTSPRTAIIETHRQLRQARAQLKELEDVKDEVSRLKAELLAERRKSGKLAEENRKLAGDLSRSSSKIVELEKKLDDSRNEARTKEREFRRLKSEHDQLKDNAKSRFSEAEQVLAKKNETISGLKDEIRSLKTEISKRPASGEERKAPRRKSYSETTYGKRSREMIPEDNSTKILDIVESRARSSLTNGLSLPQLSSNIHVDKEAIYGENQRPSSHEDEDLLISSRALRHRITTDMGKNGSSSSVLSDRANLQENRRIETSNGSNRHSYAAKDTAEPSLPTLPRTSKGDDEYGLRRKSSRSSVHRKASDIRPSSAESEAPQIDLMQSHFARLGDTVNTSTAWDISTVKTSLPAERRAAAIARLQRKKADRVRSGRAEGRNKENLLPA
jgi:septal ring factor EnvC (AmiA/AmiB activator)